MKLKVDREHTATATLQLLGNIVTPHKPYLCIFKTTTESAQFMKNLQTIKMIVYGPLKTPLIKHETHHHPASIDYTIERTVDEFLIYMKAQFLIFYDQPTGTILCKVPFEDENI